MEESDEVKGGKDLTTTLTTRVHPSKAVARSWPDHLGYGWDSPGHRWAAGTTCIE